MIYTFCVGLKYLIKGKKKRGENRRWVKTVLRSLIPYQGREEFLGRSERKWHCNQIRVLEASTGCIVEDSGSRASPQHLDPQVPRLPHFTAALVWKQVKLQAGTWLSRDGRGPGPEPKQSHEGWEGVTS